MFEQTPQAYVCGPYTNEDPARVLANVREALAAADEAAAHGWLPICPHSMGPHHGQTWEEAMDRCRYLIRSLKPGRDILVALPTWAESKGAREEVSLAMSLGVEVVQLHDLRPVI